MSSSTLTLLASFTVPVELNIFITLFWSDSTWYEKFLVEQLDDLKVSVGEWEEDNHANGILRTITSMHPSKISFPGLPSHAESIKSQTIQVEQLV